MRALLILALAGALAAGSAHAVQLDSSKSKLNFKQVQAKYREYWNACLEQGPNGAKKDETVIDCVKRKFKKDNVTVT